MDNRIPMFVTHSPTPKPEKQIKGPPPSMEKLQLYLENGATDVVQLVIDDYKLPYKIENGKLVDALVGTDLWLNKFITVDPETIEMMADVRKIAKCNDEVLIIGETGTGKETIAKAMKGDRKGSCISVNCAGIPDTLFESELFGHAKGSFTGADKEKKGLMLEANDGVLFLDEVGELSLSVQAKLLRAIQDRRIRRVGSNTEEEINCKLVCATHRNLKQMVKDGKFREDLYARISTLELSIKPLRHRQCDIVPIILSLKGGVAFNEACAAKFIDPLKLDITYNVRSLQQHVKRFTVLGRINR